MSLQLQKICILACTPLVFKHAYWFSDVQDGCLLDRCHSINMPADLLPLNQYACRFFYHSFLHACWCCVSLFAIPECMVSHYQPCLLVWSLTIGHAFWCDASLSVMPSGVLSLHRPRLLVWSLIINHAYLCGASL